MENATQSASPPQPPPHAPQPLRFNGNGAEYFGIWIVNLLLSIVTLGIYSAWAKVRRLQYFYRHTELAGSSTGSWARKPTLAPSAANVSAIARPMPRVPPSTMARLPLR